MLKNATSSSSGLRPGTPLREVPRTSRLPSWPSTARQRAKMRLTAHNQTPRHAPANKSRHAFGGIRSWPQAAKPYRAGSYRLTPASRRPLHGVMKRIEDAAARMVYQKDMPWPRATTKARGLQLLRDDTRKVIGPGHDNSPPEPFSWVWTIIALSNTEKTLLRPFLVSIPNAATE
jgi:hypothetical protein